MGKSGFKKINELLNELVAQGWHLVTAYTNELGKNGAKSSRREADK